MSSLVGSATGSIGGMVTTRRTKHAADNALQGGQLGQDVELLQNLLLPYDQLVRMGRIQPANAALYGPGGLGGQSVLGNLLSNYETQIGRADPAFASYQKAVAGGLDLGPSGLPADLEQQISRRVSANLSSRGLLDSSIGAIEEAGAIAGGSEAIRSQRLAQAQNYFSTVTQGAINQLFPTLSGTYQGELNRAISRANNAIGAAGVGAGIYDSTVKSQASLSGSLGY